MNFIRHCQYYGKNLPSNLIDLPCGLRVYSGCLCLFISIHDLVDILHNVTHKVVYNDVS